MQFKTSKVFDSSIVLTNFYKEIMNSFYKNKIITRPVYVAKKRVFSSSCFIAVKQDFTNKNYIYSALLAIFFSNYYIFNNSCKM